MVEERFTDAERVHLLELAIRAVPNHHGDPKLTAIIAKLSGTDTVLIAHRAYPSRQAQKDLPALVAELHLLVSEMVQVSSEMVEMKSLNIERMASLSEAIHQDIDGIQNWLKSHGLPVR